MLSHINSNNPVAHEVLAAVLQVRYATAAGERPPAHGPASLRVLLWRRALDPHIGRWSLPGGRLRPDEDVETSIRRQLAEKVDVKQLSHVEQLAVFSAPDRVPGPRVVATAFLGLVPAGVDPVVPEDTAWHPVDALPRTAFDHEAIVLRARDRLRAKLSYTNLGFALAPKEFTMSTLRELYSAALGYPVSATNLQRVLSRRGLLVPSGRTASPGRTGGRPAALYSFAHAGMQVTDPFAVLKPPTPKRPATRERARRSPTP
ncbi:ADP-ribose pyrophosphatase YjhB (NUDIX family) [Saccharomonospora amisosensis]|uniref:ADP-ribose pyrophosphatase YjhB (NUDIX family) n=1 Tax=Saccharomonospora amisosensis TaxID=1128677 RepID=A0A7X5ZS09_9PSEU|nr:NUDIX domain-containing protein [Saccharomonospora amisosensis]NIJ13449.1 ADP-ribose pyrophosphatase YjhB (NUDIX family) [Saccharomonospora amisosensis]